MSNVTDEDDPFGDLGDSLGDDVEPVDADTEPDNSSEPAPADGTPTADHDTSEGDTETEGEAETSPGPAFTFDDVKQRPLYARPANWDAFEDTLQFEVRRILRDRGYRDVPKRELHDAALRVLADRPHAIADAVEAARQED